MEWMTSRFIRFNERSGYICFIWSKEFIGRWKMSDVSKYGCSMLCYASGIKEYDGEAKT